MKKLLACLFVAAFVGCTPKEADDDDGKTTAPGAAAAASPAPKSGDWMWKKGEANKKSWSLESKGSLKGNADPLHINDDPLDQKAHK